MLRAFHFFAKPATHAGRIATRAVSGVAVIALLGIATWRAVALSREHSQVAETVARTAQLDAELTQLRAKRNASVQQLRTTEQEITRLAAIPDVELDAEVAGWLDRVAKLHELAAQQPERTIPEFSLLTDKDWFNAARDATSIDHDELRGLVELLALRTTARMRLGPLLREAVVRFADDHDGHLPDDVLQLEPYLKPPVGPGILARYEMVQHGNLVDVPPADWLLDEKSSFDEAGDTRLYLARAHLGTIGFSEVRPPDLRAALQAYLAANGGQFPSAPAQLVPFFSRNPSPVVLKAFLEKPATDFTPEELRKLLPPD